MNKKDRNSTEEPPPVFKSWTTWYVIVLIFLAGLVGFFYFISKTFQ